uniref:Subunit 2 of solanesyl diphosphate synthase n=1 Tax=Schmidtea mediterranea TaxID=79327 RepID=A0A0U4Z8R2_SCHMD|nr:subunit 2 of solanesyl diphosphate synthase [Schmidtea mediterranea]
MWKTPWQKIIKRSEQIVCYPSSLVNIRYLISDEITSVASQVRKLVGTHHPLLQTAKTLISDTQGVTELRGLIVLLISKTFTRPPFAINAEQRSVAEIVETAHTAICIHKDLVNIEKSLQNKPTNWYYDMQFGNKMATLCGDYLLASVSKALAEFQNTNIVNTVSKGIGDTIESLFCKVNVDNEENYRRYVYLSSGSLLSKCCKISVSLRTNVNDFVDLTKSDEDLAEKWSIHWCELYNICEHINALVIQLSNEKITSKIFPISKKLLQSDNLSDDLQFLHEYLCKTKILVMNSHKSLPEYDLQSKSILAEMVELLYQDAIHSLNLCRMLP